MWEFFIDLVVICIMMVIIIIIIGVYWNSGVDGV